MKHILFLLIIIFPSGYAVDLTVFEKSIEDGIVCIEHGDIPASMNYLRRGINCHWIQGGVFPELQIKIDELASKETDSKKKAALLVYSAVIELSNLKDKSILNTSKALISLKAAEVENGELPEIYNTRAMISYYNGQFKDALVDYNMAIKLNPRYLDAIHNRSNLYLKLNEMKLSVEDYAHYQDLLNSLYYENKP